MMLEATAADATRGARLLERARAANAAARHQRALEICDAALNLGERGGLGPCLRRERSLALLAMQRLEEALADARRACGEGSPAEHRPLMGEILLRLGRGAEAASVFRALLETSPEDGGLWWSLGRACLQAGRADEAVAALEQADRWRPSTREIRMDLARALAADRRTHDACDVLQALVRAAPEDVDARVFLGVLEQSRGRSAQAVRQLRRVLRDYPWRTDAHFNLGLAELRLSNCRKGWRHYEWRQAEGGNERRMGVPAWRGEPLAHRRLLIWSEQGNGDMIQFARFVRVVRERGADTVCIVPSSLVRLFRCMPDSGEVVPRVAPYPRGDFQTLLASLPHRLGLDSPFVEPWRPYLVAEPGLRAEWARRLDLQPCSQRLASVALVWQGNPHFVGDYGRSMPLAHHVPVLRAYKDRIRFFSLQKNVGREQLAGLPPDLRFVDVAAQASSLPNQPGLFDLGGVIDNGGDAFVDTAAILSLCDLLITTDTAIAHLSGALGVPTWLLLGAVPDFRWGSMASDTAWYPSMRFFRQRTPGEWDDSVARVSTALRAIAAD